MAAPRLLVYVQHLLGIGHLMRAATLARAAAESGFAVSLVSGGMPSPQLALGGAALVQLPPLRSRDESFAVLVDREGNPLDEPLRQARREALLRHFAEFAPDALLFDMFPFGRRALHFELLPLLEAALARRPRPLVVCSVRDIVQRPRKPEREAETLALLARGFDRVLVHGDPALVRFEESFPPAGQLAGKLAYTGYVATPPCRRGAPEDPGWGEVLVSAGGGHVGTALLAASLAARPLGALAGCPWRLLVSRQIAEPDFATLRGAAGAGLTVERARPDFPQLLANCRLSVSQAGYNTAMDVLSAGARSVLVPFEGGDETEQRFRAERLAARGLAHVLLEAELGPGRLAQAIDAADAMAPPQAAWLRRDGAATSLRLIAEDLAARGRRNLERR